MLCEAGRTRLCVFGDIINSLIPPFPSLPLPSPPFPSLPSFHFLFPSFTFSSAVSPLVVLFLLSTDPLSVLSLSFPPSFSPPLPLPSPSLNVSTFLFLYHMLFFCFYLRSLICLMVFLPPLPLPLPCSTRFLLLFSSLVPSFFFFMIFLLFFSP